LFGFWFLARPERSRRVSGFLLRTFDHIVFSTVFEEALYEKNYPELPAHCVIENAVPSGLAELHAQHHPFRLLFIGRFVAFKNLSNLLRALVKLPRAQLTLVGDGPQYRILRQLVSQLGLERRVMFVAPLTGAEKEDVFKNHDLLILPSFTEISPNVALEARVLGIPILLTQETGLSPALSAGMVLADLSTPERITEEILRVQEHYSEHAEKAFSSPHERGWDRVAEEHLELFRSKYPDS
jgi:glycosyltransferase involved in cell wall biosynthesis